MTTTNQVPIKLPKIFRPFECLQLIRLGKDNDGGYIVNKHDVDKTDLLISFGIGNDWSFEKSFSENNNCSIFCFDKTTKVPLDNNFFIENHKLISKNIDFNNSDETISFDDVISAANNNIFLKCDIEGDEYKFLEKIINCSCKFTSIVIEFHDVFIEENFNTITNFISKVGLNLVHLHANNCTTVRSGDSYLPYAIEMTFTSSNNIKYNPNKITTQS